MECGVIAGCVCLGCNDAKAKEKGEILEGSRMESPKNMRWPPIGLDLVRFSDLMASSSSLHLSLFTLYKEGSLMGKVRLAYV
jgi:hypothetical protein